MKSKYLPELVIMWLTAIMVVCLVTSCTSSRTITIKTPTVNISGSSGWKHVNLKGNRTAH